MTGPASQPEHDFHGFAQYDWCPDCRYALAEQRSIDDQLCLTEIGHQVAVLNDGLMDAARGLTAAQQAAADLMSDRVYDVELTEGHEGADLVAELATAGRAIRNAARIAVLRADMLRANRDAAEVAILQVVQGDREVDDGPALDRIAKILSDSDDWNADVTSAIFHVVTESGRHVCGTDDDDDRPCCERD